MTIQLVFNEVSLFTFSKGTHGFDITVPENYLKRQYRKKNNQHFFSRHVLLSIHFVCLHEPWPWSATEIICLRRKFWTICQKYFLKLPLPLWQQLKTDRGTDLWNQQLPVCGSWLLFQQRLGLFPEDKIHKILFQRLGLGKRHGKSINIDSVNNESWFRIQINCESVFFSGKTQAEEAVLGLGLWINVCEVFVSVFIIKNL